MLKHHFTTAAAMLPSAYLFWLCAAGVAWQDDCWRWKRRPTRLIAAIVMLMYVLVAGSEALAFRVFDVSTYSPADFSDLGISRWNAEPHFVDGVERSLDGGLRYSVEGGSYEAFRDRFNWSGTAPTVAEFQSAVEEAFAAWEAPDPVTGLGTDIYFVPDFDTPIVIEPFPSSLQGYARLNRGAEIDIVSAALSSEPNTIGITDVFGDPNVNSVTLTSGVTNYSAAVISGSDIQMRTSFISNSTEVPWNVTKFKEVLRHEIGHALAFGDVDVPTGEYGSVSAFYDDNYDGTSHATARTTLTNSFADLIDPLDPDNSPLIQVDICTNQSPDCASSPGVDSPDVHLMMEGSPQMDVDLQNDEFAGRQFLYPYLLSEADFDGNGHIDGADLLVQQRHWGATEDVLFSDGDADGDGDVDKLDLTAWHQHFGRLIGGQSPAVVPEPASLTLIVLAVVAFLKQRREVR